jgi:hypothetical protein
MQHGYMDYYHLRLYNVNSTDLIRRANKERLAQETEQVHRMDIADTWQARIVDWLAGVWLALSNHEEHAAPQAQDNTPQNA